MNELPLILLTHLFLNEYSNWLFLITYKEKIAPKMKKKIQNHKKEHKNYNHI